MHPTPMATGPTGGFWTSRSLALTSLLAANVVTIIFFAIYDGSMLQVLWVYWTQSVIIGVVNVVRMLSMNLNLAGLRINGTPVDPHSAISRVTARVFMAGFFGLHYGIFHAAYAGFLVAFGADASQLTGSEEPNFLFGTVSVAAVVLSGVVFAVHHFVSYAGEWRAARDKPATEALSIASAMLRPYLRIIPMHFIIMLGPVAALLSGSTAAFVIFMVLKTIFDVRLYQKGTGHPLAKPHVPDHRMTPHDIQSSANLRT